MQWKSINSSGPNPNIFICVQLNRDVRRAAVAPFQGGENHSHEMTVHCTLISISCVYCKQIKEQLLTGLLRFYCAQRKSSQVSAD